MDVKLTTGGKRVMSFTTEIPALSNHQPLPGARRVFVQADLGTILFSEIGTPWFTIWHQYLNIEKPGSLEAAVDEPLLNLHIVLRGHVRYQFQDNNNLKWSEGQLNLFCSGSLKVKAFFDDMKEYTTLTIRFHRSYLDVYAPYFPALQHFLDRADNGEEAFLSASNTSLTPEMITIIRDMLYSDYTGEVRTLYLRNKVSELLLLAFTRIVPGTAGASDIRLHQYDIDKIREAREYLLQNMEHPLTVIELSHKVGINDFKLKKGFKQLYGVTIFDFLLEARMEKARSLLTETDTPIHEIAFATGYKNVSSFTAAFKKRMGFPPSAMKRNK
ncbi:helix-turn-helix domain-containing protein [Pseudobacter ginsenosidimutans]|uniref:AraC-like DNA-binding protein n=1 Tax=Pseudobacter ginsenosidimutans TaxID=661488 RepID=A0A4Q7MAN3_9BACT|nr:AraC family transcriptional regulator [Pseudobacter ginsenosidimutans]QEC42785.1 helix-turn-helix transcriptional regulator [Pseudobacter ginsenosidimutans]RZS65056.1 AraC-like DNA-binding protein [Pseudobacter ginsenosidimutans]